MIILEKATNRNIPEIHQVQKAIFKKLYDKYQDDGSPFKESEASLIEKINRPNVYFFLIKRNEKTVGYVRISANENLTRAKIGPIGVVPEYEESGLGTEAMFLIEKEFPSVKEWYLDTILQEPKLTRFYSKLGYIETGQVESIQKGMDILFFMKKLD